MRGFPPGRNRGLTLVELSAGMLLMGLLAWLIFSVWVSTSTGVDMEISLRDSQIRLQFAMDRLCRELREGSATYAWTGTFTDPNFPTPQSWLLVLVARLGGMEGAVQTENQQPSWKQAILYAPYAPRGAATGQLRRYSIQPIPSSLLFGRSPAVTATSTTFHVAGVAVERSGGDVFLTDVQSFGAAKGTNVEIAITVLAETPEGKVPTSWSTRVWPRN